MRVESHRAARYIFSASVELIDVQSEKFVNGRTRDLSVFGCFVLAANPFPVGTKVSLRITHGGSSMSALGKVVSSSANSGMGVVFSKLETAAQATLEKWMSSLRSS